MATDSFCFITHWTSSHIHAVSIYIKSLFRRHMHARMNTNGATKKVSDTMPCHHLFHSLDLTTTVAQGVDLLTLSIDHVPWPGGFLPQPQEG